MSPTNNQTTQAQPMQVGTQKGEVADLIEEIGQSGVANSPAQVEGMDAQSRDHGDSDPAQMPTPIITGG